MSDEEAELQTVINRISEVCKDCEMEMNVKRRRQWYSANVETKKAKSWLMVQL